MRKKLNEKNSYWQLIHCSVRGRSHIKNDIPCQDKTYVLQKNDVKVIALADGAGSAKNSHIGAACLVQCVAEFMTENFDVLCDESDGALVKKIILDYARNKLRKIAEEWSVKLNTLASTFLMVAVKNNNVIIAHIGDGVIGYMKNGNMYVASAPVNGEFTNTTYFVTSQEAAVTMKLLKAESGGIDGFILMSDGSENSLYNRQRRCLGKATEMLMIYARNLSKKEAEKMLENTLSKSIIQKTMDDCSIAIMVRSLKK